MSTVPALRAPAGVARPPAALREVSLAAAAALVYFGVRNVTAGSAGAAFENAERIRDLERVLGIAWEQALQAQVVAHDVLLTLANWVYIWGHWPVIVGAAILLYRRRRDRYLLLRDAILLSGAIGFLFFAIFPVAPPRLADPLLVDTITQQSSSYRALQPPGLTNQYAALPSLHAGWNLLVGIAVWGASTRLWVRGLAAASPAAMAVAVVVTANHYLLDVVAGYALVLAALLVVRQARATRSV